MKRMGRLLTILGFSTAFLFFLTSCGDETISNIQEPINNYEFLWNNIDSCSFTYEENGEKHSVEATIEKREEKAASCIEDGLDTYTATVTVDGNEYSETKSQVVQATGHEWDYENGVFEFVDQDHVDYLVKCKHDENHTKSFSCVKKDVETIDATSDAHGYQKCTYSVEIDNKEYSSIYYSNDTHYYHHVDAVASTCINEGNIEYYVCDVCGKYFDLNYGEILEADTILPKVNHNFTHHNKVDATYLACGNLEYNHCEVCGIDKDMDGNTLTDVTISKLTDLGLKINGTYNNMFTKLSESDNCITWTLTVDLKQNDLIELIEGRDGKSFSYSTAIDSNLNDEFKVIQDANSAEIIVTYTSNRFVVSVSGLEELGVFLVVTDSNGVAKYPMNEVTYSYDTEKTSYVFGYWYFEKNSIIYISDTINNKEYDYYDLDASVLWKTKYFGKASDGNILIKTTERLEIEFSVNGDEKILINSVFGPTAITKVEAEIKGNEELVPLSPHRITEDAEEYAYLLHTLTHESATNKDDILEYIQTNGLWVYYAVGEIPYDSHIRIVVNGNMNLGFTNLDAYTGDSSYNIKADSDDYIIVSKPSGYIFGYYPAFGTLYLLSDKSVNGYEVSVKGHTTSLTVVGEYGYINNVEMNKFDAIFFSKDHDIINITLDSSVPAAYAMSADGSSVMFYKAGTYNVRINISTNIVYVEKLDEDIITLDDGYAVNSITNQSVNFEKIGDNLYKASGVEVTAEDQSIGICDSNYDQIPYLSLDSDSQGYTYKNDVIFHPAIGKYDITVDLNQMTIHIDVAA